MKTCSVCHSEKLESEFRKRSRSKDGLEYRCKACVAIADAAYRKAHPDKIKARRKAYYAKHSEQICAQSKAWHQANTERSVAARKVWRLAHRAEQDEKIKAWHSAHRDDIRAYKKEYARAHRDEANERNRRWRAAHPERNLTSVRNWYKKNPERGKMIRNRETHKRRLRIEQAGEHYSIAQWESLKAEYDYTCLSCGRKEPEIKLTGRNPPQATGL
jgi:hypothetical protein